MNVFAAINGSADKPYWVSRSTFCDRFDQDDFYNREVIDVTSAYHKNWFYRSCDGRLMFFIPVSGAIGKRSDIFNRHRIAVLLPHLEELPIAFAMGHLRGEARRFIESIPKRSLDISKSFWIPDFPIKENIP